MKKNIKVILVLFPCFLFLFSCKNETKEKTLIAKDEWVDLLSKNTLEDWIVKIKGHPVGENYNNTFRLKNGVLKVDYTEYKDTFNNTFGHIYYKKPFSNYRLRLDYRFLDDQISDGEEWAYKNSGLMIHCENPENIGLDQGFPVSIEVQMLGGNGEKDRPTANLCTPGTHVTINNQLMTDHCTSSNSKTFHDDQWIRLEVEVYSDSLIRHYINDKIVMEYSKPIYGGDYSAPQWKSMEGKPVTSGYISLQSESHPIEFKNIEVLELN